VSRGLAAAVLAATLAALPAEAFAQTTGLGVVFGGLGTGLCGGCGAEAILHVGGGGELILGDQVAIGGDVGFIGPVRYLEAGLGLASFNGSYRFGGPRDRTRPFVTGGYSVLFRDGSFNAINFGAGFDRWLSGGLGLRFEVRDHVPLFDDGFEVHYLDVRVGLVFR
jgi:hypothetical protein